MTSFIPASALFAAPKAISRGSSSICTCVPSIQNLKPWRFESALFRRVGETTFSAQKKIFEFYGESPQRCIATLAREDRKNNNLPDPNSVPSEVEIVDDSGLPPILCTVEELAHHNGVNFVLLKPKFSTVEVYRWDGPAADMNFGSAEEVEAIDVEDPRMDKLFPVASEFLSRDFGLTLHRSALVATVEGDFPDCDPEDIVSVGLDDEYEPEEFQVIDTFPFEQQKYSLLTPLVPPLYYGRFENGRVHLLSPEEYQKHAETLEQVFFVGDDMDQDQINKLLEEQGIVFDEDDEEEEEDEEEEKKELRS
eukprot:CAMPEP_0196658196 /NCGR_PEP_ID=MMETSP1086-20130531/27960_1 /TAXON_ID=77921 /ORGANISM="Cyanoptyche  gloeocystis , Strain SAG4.97" /LENGTH=307 /DNA_ID=CAMNT_0041991659 /DNA_START=55 /DNA_END=978 /DNA_ORIENTATION=+